MNRRTPAQDQVLHAYRLERRLGYCPLDAINNVRSQTANVIAHFVVQGREVPRLLLDEWRAADVSLRQLRARALAEPVNLRTIGRRAVPA